MSGTDTVRELTAAEVAVRPAYFHGASDAELEAMGVDRQLLPPAERWLADIVADLDRPDAERVWCTLGWFVDDRLVGFSTLDQIVPGDEAHFHLHVVAAAERGSGLGRRFVPPSTAWFMERFALRRLVSEPWAFNVASNRTLQAAGFRYERTHVLTPGAINPEQPVTRWVLERSRPG